MRVSTFVPAVRAALVAALVTGAMLLAVSPPEQAIAVSSPVGRMQAAVAPSPAATPLPTPTPFAVTIDKDGFHPPGIHISPGQSVTWTNADKVQHTATAVDGSWDTGPIDPGHSATLQFFETRRWEYVCGFRPMLRATLIVATPAPTSRAGTSQVSLPAIPASTLVPAPSTVTSAPQSPGPAPGGG